VSSTSLTRPRSLARPVSLIAALALVLTLVECRDARANLVTNGSFELTTNGNGQLGYNTNAIGWTSTGYTFIFAPGTADTTGAPGSIGTDYLWGPGNGSPNGLTISPDGGNFVAADGGYDPGPISQTITGLTFGEPCTQTQLTPIVNNASEGFTGWTYETMNFTADGPSDLLSFLAVGTPTGEPPFALLDGISANVPEPSSVLLIAAVGAGCAGFRRFRRQAASK